MYFILYINLILKVGAYFVKLLTIKFVMIATINIIYFKGCLTDKIVPGWII